MSANIDERVVQMKFQNSQFLAGIKDTLSALDQLKKGLNFDGATKSLDTLNEASRRFSLTTLANATEAVSAKFVAMATVAITALTNIANRAVDVGANLVKSLTIDPIKAGLSEYETTLNSIQTILANTQSKGTTLQNVNAALEELNLYSDKTIYNFAEMARNIGTFTAAGVGLDASTNAIKGIANLAAMSGSNSQQASTAMYQLSQALAAGKVSLMDWNSVVNAGMGGEVFQNSLKETARVHGVAIDDMVKKDGSFRETLQRGWLTSDILTETLSKFTGDLNAQQLKTMGYTDQQIAGIIKMAETASDAATKVKTLPQLIGTLQESAQSGWSKTWQIIFGDFEEAKDLFTGVNNVLGGMISASANARNELLQGWKDLGGRTVSIEALKNAFDAVMQVLSPIKEAFKDIFPPATAEQLFNITSAIRDFTAKLKISSDTAAKIKSIFSGVFSIFDIGVMIVKGILGVFKDLGSELGSGSGGILDYAAALGDWITNVRNAIKNGEGLSDFFKGLSKVIATPIKVLKELASWVANLFGPDGLVSQGTGDALSRLEGRLSPFSRIGDAIAGVWSNLGGVFKNVWTFFKPLADAMENFFSGFGALIANSAQDMDFSLLLDSINTGLLAGLVVMFKKFLSNGLSLDFGGGFLESAKDALDGVSGSLQAMQTNLKADTLLKIASAIGLLTLSIVGLSLVDSERLTSSLTAMTVMFGQLLISMSLFEKIGATKGFLKMPFVAIGMILLAGAIVILTAAVKNLSELDWEGLAKGLVGVTVLLGALVGTAKLLQDNSAGMISSGAGLILMAVAIKILASAVKDFADMDWESMAKGFAGLAGTLAALSLFTKLTDLSKAGITQTAGLILMAVALKVIASAVKDFAGMTWDELAHGLAGLAGSLILISAAMIVMTGTLSGAAALFVVSASLVVLAQALKAMGGFSWEEIGKGLIVLAGSLVIIAAGMYLMAGAIPGALALIIVAGALAILGPVLLALGGMSWEEIGKGLVMLAGAFVVIGLAGLVLSPIIPSLLGLGAAIALIGIGVMAAGVGLLAFSAGLLALSVAGAAGTAAMVALVSSLIGLIPTIVAAFGKAIVMLIEVLITAGPQFLAMAVVLITTLLQAIDTVAPKIISTLVKLIGLLLDAIVVMVPKFVDSGLKLITGILTGISNNIGKVVAAATDVVVNFITAIGKNAPRIVQAGVDMIINFTNALADGIRNNTAKMQEAGRNLASAIIEGITGGLSKGVSAVVDAAKTVARNALNAAKSLLGINSPSKEFYDIGVFSTKGMAMGLDNTSDVVAKSAEGVGKNALTAIKETMANASQMINANMDLSPTVTPILDLTAVNSEAKKLGGIFGSAKLNAAVGFDAAQAVLSDEQLRSKEFESDLATPTNVITNNNFTQNNTSPKALPASEIYRKSKSLLATVREG